MTSNELEQRIAAVYAARDREHMAPTIAAFEALLAEDPADPRRLYEVAGAYDTAGDEARAVSYYEAALAAGLDGDALRRCLLQYGSTLRNLERHEEALAVWDRALAAFPGSASVRVFAAISLHAAGRSDDAVAALLDLVADDVPADDLDRYRPALRGNATWLREAHPR